MIKQINVENISKSFYTRENLFSFNKKEIKALENITFDVKEKEIYGIVGKNGAGKTTLIKILSGIMKSDEGYIKILEETPFKRTKNFCERVTIIMGQKGQMNEDVSILDNALFMSAIYKINEKDAIERIKCMSNELGISDCIFQQVRTLSLGQRMKGEILIAFLHRPKIIFLDEPTLGLDYTTQVYIRSYLKKYVEENNASIILTSHNIEDIEVLCNKILVLDKGKMLYKGNIANLKNSVQPTKYIIFNSNYDYTQIKQYNFKKGNKENEYKILINNETEKDVIKLLINDKRVSNLNIVLQDLNEIIEELYRRV